MQKIFLIPLGLVRQHNSPKPYCSPSIIIQGNFHLSKHPRERFYRFYKNGANNQDNVLLLFKGENTPLEDKGKLICKRTSVPPPLYKRQIIILLIIMIKWSNNNYIQFLCSPQIFSIEPCQLTLRKTSFRG